ncbi:ubiquinone biosynthesis protein COQ7-domain-containing protein [Fusarium oxysporum Fo47]|uniref:ubiquinone biosynthesis protein COQ7-domain-containing protein n=1 Tax=Fusarium oxysporum Fo47 TaxID=660027 RepID=UPI002869D5E3|nr:ubiquinone biosynthesis protein COQ7-domain-containing protein [Fusarium oxysporum Fo47]QKD57156.2 ubiquinone biosynthesis protein COQ7-domain-containing protein [Fusarium oxysporum Fo47]
MPIHNSFPRALYKAWPLLSPPLAWKASFANVSRRFTTSERTHQSVECSLRKPKRKPLTPEQQDYISAAIRVNQAGELGAVLIYAAQTPIVVKQHPELRQLMQHMYYQEVGHLSTFNNLITEHRIRPTVMYPLWQALATGLGWATAMMGKEVAMACTEAVEKEIGTHYNEQVQEVIKIIQGWEEEGYEAGPEILELLQTLRRIRDEELEHLDHAVDHDAKKAPLHDLLTGFVRASCRGAIFFLSYAKKKGMT